MKSRDIEAEIDRLYQMSPEEFTDARNALAKQLDGEEARRVKSLKKPNLAAWAVNQLHWRAPAIEAELRKAIEHLREAHGLVLAGRAVDLAGATTAHREALKRATAKVHEILREAARPITMETTRSITQTLEALRDDGVLGRLDRPLSPEGFDALKDVVSILPGERGETNRSRTSANHGSKAAAARGSTRETERRKPGRDEEELSRAHKTAQKDAERERARVLKEAIQDLQKAERRLTEARAAERDTRRELDAARKKLDVARKADEATRLAHERAALDRAAREEETARAARVAEQAIAAHADAERAVREAREKLKSRR